LSSVIAASPRPFTSLSRSIGAEIASAKEPKRAMISLASGLTSPRGSARNKTSSSSS